MKYKIGIRAYENGNVQISQTTARVLDLRDGDAIDYVVSKEEIYLVKVANPSPFRKGILSPQKTNSRRLRTYYKDLTALILDHEPRGAFRLGDLTTINGVPMLPIITRVNYAIQ